MIKYQQRHQSHQSHSRQLMHHSNMDQYPPISRTMQYKKITKPLLERKRRARINRCLDELKDLMVDALEAEGENINKLEKADILELTVRHLQRITRARDPVQDAHRFQAGFTHCASEACTFLLSLPGLDSIVGRRLVEHLRKCVASPGVPYRSRPEPENEQPLSLPPVVPSPLRLPFPVQHNPNSPIVPTPVRGIPITPCLGSVPASSASGYVVPLPNLSSSSGSSVGSLPNSSVDGNHQQQSMWRPW